LSPKYWTEPGGPAAKHTSHRDRQAEQIRLCNMIDDKFSKMNTNEITYEDSVLID